MSKTTKFFYAAWVIAWFILGIGASILLVSLRHDGSQTIFDLEAWFVTFPIAWTIAVLMARHKDFWDTFSDHPITKRLNSVAIFGMIAWNGWQNAVRHHSALGKTAAIFIFLFAVTGVLTLAAELLPKIRARLSISNQP